MLSELVLLGGSAVFSGGHDGTVHPVCGQLNNGAHRSLRPSPRNLTWHIGQGSPGKQNQQDVCVRGKGIRKADRSHNLPSAICRLETREEAPGSVRAEGRVNSFLSGEGQPSRSLQVFSWLGEATHMTEGSLLYPVYPFKCQSLPQTASQTHPDSHQASGNPTAQSS